MLTGVSPSGQLEQIEEEILVRWTDGWGETFIVHVWEVWWVWWQSGNRT